MTNLHAMLEKLKQERDELHVRLHLAKSEVKDEWEQTETKFRHFESRLGRLGHEAKESAEEVGEALQLVGEEIAHAYRRIRDTMD